MNMMRLKQLSLITLSLLPIAVQAQDVARKQSHYAAAVNLLHITEDNVGFGFSYEHLLNEQNSISLYLPFSYALSNNNNNGFYYSTEPQYFYPGQYGYDRYMTDLQDRWTVEKGMAYFYPGVKFYTGKKLARVSYCVGASLLVGVGQGEQTTVNYRLDTLMNGAQEYYMRSFVNSSTEHYNRIKLGMMVTNALNIRMSTHIYTGLELGLGYSYLNKEAGVSLHREMLAQIGLKLGYYR